MPLNAQGRPLTSQSSALPAASDLAAAQRIIVLVPSEHVVLLEMPSLAGSRSQVEKAVPYALEDRLASSVEDLHFALPDRLENRAALPVAVVAAETLSGWIKRLAEQGIQADAMYCEAQVLPYADKSGSLLVDAQRAIWRFGVARGGACGLDELSGWLDVAAASESGLPQLEVFDFRNAPALDLPASRYHANQRDPLELLCRGLTPEPEVNLLQGAFAPAHHRAPARALWRRATMLAAAAVVLAFGYQLADYWRLSHQSARLDRTARSVLHQGFPQMDKVPGDPGQLMRSALGALHADSDSTGLLHLLSQIAPILGSTTRTTLTGLEYHNATLELALSAPDVPTLDLMRERLSNLPGLTAQVTAANNSDNGIDGRLRISGARR